MFLRAVEIQPLFAPEVTRASCILHSVCATEGDTLEEEEEKEGSSQDDYSDDEDERELSGNAFWAAARVSTSCRSACVSESACLHLGSKPLQMSTDHSYYTLNVHSAAHTKT